MSGRASVPRVSEERGTRPARSTDSGIRSGYCGFPTQRPMIDDRAGRRTAPTAIAAAALIAAVTAIASGCGGAGVTAISIPAAVAATAARATGAAAVALSAGAAPSTVALVSGADIAAGERSTKRYVDQSEGGMGIVEDGPGGVAAVPPVAAVSAIAAVGAVAAIAAVGNEVSVVVILCFVEDDTTVPALPSVTAKTAETAIATLAAEPALRVVVAEADADQRQRAEFLIEPPTSSPSWPFVASPPSCPSVPSPPLSP